MRIANYDITHDGDQYVIAKVITVSKGPNEGKETLAERKHYFTTVGATARHINELITSKQFRLCDSLVKAQQHALNELEEVLSGLR